MKKQIQKNGLVMKALMLTLSTLGSSMLCADWHSLSSSDTVDWLVNHGEKLTGYELDQAVRSLDWEDKERFISLLSDQINNAVEERGFAGLSKGNVYDLIKKIDSLQGTYRAQCVGRLSRKAKEVMLVRNFELNPEQHPIPVEVWWQFSPFGQQKCFSYFLKRDQKRIQSKILAGDLAFKIRYFEYLDLKDQRRIWNEELKYAAPAVKALCFKCFGADEQKRIWIEEFTGNPILKAACAGWLKEPLLQLFWNELDEYTKERLRWSGMTELY